MKEGVLKVWCFYCKRLRLTAWLREYMSGRNPFSGSASSPKLEEKLRFSSPRFRRPEKSLVDQVFEAYIPCSRFTSVLKPKNIGTWDATKFAKVRFEHHYFHHCLSRFFTSDDNLQHAL